MSIETRWAETDIDWQAQSGSPSIGNGSLRFRYRRQGGQLLWAFELIVGSTTTFGTGRWAFFLGETADFLSVAGAIEPPVTALATDASVTGAGTPGVLSIASGYNWAILGQSEPEIFAQVLYSAVVGHFGSARLGAAAPYSWAVGDRIVGGNAFEALDN